MPHFGTQAESKAVEAWLIEIMKEKGIKTKSDMPYFGTQAENKEVEAWLIKIMKEKGIKTNEEELDAVQVTHAPKPDGRSCPAPVLVSTICDTQNCLLSSLFSAARMLLSSS